MDEEDLLPPNTGRRNAGNIQGASQQRRWQRMPNEASPIQTNRSSGDNMRQRRPRTNSTNQQHHPVQSGSGQANSIWRANRNLQDDFVHNYHDGNAGNGRDASQQRRWQRMPNEASPIQTNRSSVENMRQRRPRTNSTNQRHHPVQSGSGQANSIWRADRNHHNGTRMNRSNLYASADDVQILENTNVVRNRRNYADTEPNRNYNEGRSNRQQTNHMNKNERRYPMGFKALEELSLSDSKDILEKINKRRTDFLDVIGHINEEKKDLFFLVLEILTKVSLSSFDELKQKLLLDVINSSFLINLTNYLMNLHYTTTRDKERNKLYWNNQSKFWQNFITFSESIFNVAPSLAMQKCRPLLDLCKLCLGELNARHQFVLSDENEKRFTELRGRMTAFEQKEEEKKCQRIRNKNDAFDERDPPENFRELSVVPSCDDLLVQKPFLRANVVQGGYTDVEHYLDVQFRLLREDCFGPLREGLLQYVDNPARQKYDNIRVYRNVRVYGPFVSKTHVGIIIQLDENTVKRLKRINWSHSKRFIFGSLLLFTNDNCRSFITATIIDRDPKNLTAGRIPVSIIETVEAPVSKQFNSDAVYVMIESEVYFEPYQHVLKVLRDPRFPEKLAMSKYIVNVEPQATPPKYLDDFTRYSVNIEGLKYPFIVLQPGTWPSCEQLGLNESQYEAFKLALTHEFAVIQGPPGTGKTFLGVNVAKTLLTNIQVEQRCLMLVICYTNHALDQFLEHILNITDSIVRVGGQSRNPAMEAISLNNLRRSNNSRRNNAALNLYFSERHNLRMIMAELQTAQNRIQSLHDGVLSYESMKDYIPEIVVLEQHYNVRGGDILRNWLFQNTPYVDVEQSLLERTDDEDSLPLTVDESEENTRTATILDDLDNLDENEIDINGVEIKTTFLLDDAEKKLKQIIAYYRKSNNRQERQSLEIEIRDLNSRITLFKEMREVYKTTGEREFREGENLKRLPNADRWGLYFTWTNKVITSVKEEIKPLQEKVNTAVASYEEARMILDLKLIERKKVVGLTTSGAARLRKLLEALAPSIVIVEEAAEVLEQHIVTSLPSSCKHLILIGDHQQLRPSAAYMKLARRFNYDVSLFERMINNGMHSRRLGVQHRMRPEIAALISPHIYKNLVNHPSVHAFPHVRGVTTDLFFFTHNYMEEAVEDSASRCNHKEADLTLGLANYIMQQGYQPEDVTILAAYTGQMFYMKKQRPKYVFLDNVKITVVDNYQGEESKIILLSLVRNNDQNKIGFLGTENRICVALSRAKEGFYIFGNINILTANSELWSNIAKTLEDVGSIGSELRLKCENHANKFTQITSPKDFEKVPEGGCLLKCNYNLPACGHRCPRICHAYDLEHSKAKCLMACERVICELRHPCPWKCGEKCRPCRQRIVKTLPCGHPKEVYCHEEPNDPTIMCTTTVTIVLTVCGHTAKKACHIDLNKVVCMVPCKYRVECGHECRLCCHVGDDPDHERYECQKPCAKAKRGCTANVEGDRGDHQCSRRCHEQCEDCNVEVMKKRSNCKHSDRVKCCQDVDEEPCRKKCARSMTCGHFCKNKCFEPCGDCNQKVTKIIPGCKHKIELACKEEAKQELCRERCERKLPCGHKCTKLCGQKCDENACVEIIDRELASPCGHRVKLPCNLFIQGFSDPELLMSHCTVPCNTTLMCEHVCRGTCAQCLQGRLHAACAQPCHVPMICGHQCEEPCNQLCPPCKKPCEVKCSHSQCNKVCGAPCVPCKEKCKRECPHGRCSRLCGSRCSRAACDAPCPRTLRCAHPCRGLCGEPCPDICHICRPDDFPKDFLGYDFEEDAKFIKLQDCPHLLEVEDADNLMQGDKESITIRSCPLCRKPIINTYRYKDLVNEMYRTEINPIKEKIYGTAAQVVEKRTKLADHLTDFEKKHMDVVAENLNFGLAFKKVKNTFITKKKVSMLQLDMNFLYIEILDRIGDYYKQFKEAKLSELKEDFLGQISLMSGVLTRNIQKISQQQQEDIGRELKRMNSMIQLSKILRHSSYLSTKQDPKVAAAANEAKSVITSKGIFIEHEAVVAMKKFEETVKLTGIVSREEQALIVKAIGLKQGHWFKCPNGHFYCIDQCGGAMEVSRCIECNAPVGGQNHQLLSSNVHAGEIDGSSFPAWSNHYNNMANFDLRNIN